MALSKWPRVTTTLPRGHYKALKILAKQHMRHKKQPDVAGYVRRILLDHISFYLTPELVNVINQTEREDW